LRLGASLAAVAGGGLTADEAVHAAVLWEPIVSGAGYLAELRQVQRDWVRATFVRHRPIQDAGGTQVLGFKLAARLREGMRGLDLTSLRIAPARHILILQNEDGQHLAGLRSTLEASVADVVFDHLEARPPWMGEQGRTIAIASPEVLGRVVQWLSEVCG